MRASERAKRWRLVCWGWLVERRGQESIFQVLIYCRIARRGLMRVAQRELGL